MVIQRFTRKMDIVVRFFRNSARVRISESRVYASPAFFVSLVYLFIRAKEKRIYLDDNMPRQSINRHIGTLLLSRCTGLHTQRARKIRPQRLEIPFGLLNLGLPLGATGFGHEVDGQLVGRGATDKVGKVGEVQGRRRLSLILRLSLGVRVAGGVSRRRSAGGGGFTGEFGEECAGLLDGEERVRGGGGGGGGGGVCFSSVNVHVDWEL